MNRLTDEQKALAAEHVEHARMMAAKFSRRCPRRWEDYVSAALEGLVDAAGRYDPARGVPFEKYASARIQGAMLDASRSHLPSGFRRDAANAPEQMHLDIQTCDGVTVGEALVSDELPVGWELESEDTVARLAAKLPGKRGQAVRAFYLHADTDTMKRAGAVIGCSESHVSQMLMESAAMLRGAM